MANLFLFGFFAFCFFSMTTFLLQLGVMSFVFLQNQSSNFLHRDKLKKSSLHYNNVSLFSYPRKTVNSPLRRRFEQTSVSVICENRPL